jgi:hypothetical protein
MSKTALQIAVLLTVVSARSQCHQNPSGLLDQVTINGFQSLHSLHDYVWIDEEHGTYRDGKGKIHSAAYRHQNVVANGKMYSRTLKPGEEPRLPESEAALSTDYRVLPFECEGRPCLYPYAFFPAIFLRDLWNVRQVDEGELQGKKMLVLDLHAKNLPHPGYGPISGKAWVDPERCRVVRVLVTSAKPNGHDQSHELFEFGEVKGAWLPVRRERHGDDGGKFVAWVHEYTYLRFGVSTRMVP